MMVNDNNRDRGGLYDNIGEPTTIKLMKLFFDKSTSIIALKNVVNNNSNNNTEFHLTLPEMYKPFSNNLKSIFDQHIIRESQRLLSLETSETSDLTYAQMPVTHLFEFHTFWI